MQSFENMVNEAIIDENMVNETIENVIELNEKVKINL